MRTNGKGAALFLLLALGVAANAVALTPPPSPRIAPSAFTSAGGETYSLSGYVFRPPVRVFFDAHDGMPRESVLLAVSTSEIRGLTPAIATGRETKLVDVYVRERAGGADEIRTAIPYPVTFTDARLPPEIIAVSPNSTSVEGGTRVTIFGSGFRAPAQVLVVFPDGIEQEMQLISISSAQIVAITPPSRTFGVADVRVVNILTGASNTLRGALRYDPRMTASAVTPASGPIAGGTRITIEGTGFGEVMAISVAGVRASVIQLTSTSITARTNAAVARGCDNVTGPVMVTDVLNGDTVPAGTFTYLAPCSPPRRRAGPR
jgi:hypothetical protein